MLLGRVPEEGGEEEGEETCMRTRLQHTQYSIQYNTAAYRAGQAASLRFSTRTPGECIRRCSEWHKNVHSIPSEGVEKAREDNPGHNRRATRDRGGHEDAPRNKLKRPTPDPTSRHNARRGAKQRASVHCDVQGHAEAAVAECNDAAVRQSFVYGCGEDGSHELPHQRPFSLGDDLGVHSRVRLLEGVHDNIFGSTCGVIEATEAGCRCQPGRGVCWSTKHPCEYVYPEIYRGSLSRGRAVSEGQCLQGVILL